MILANWCWLWRLGPVLWLGVAVVTHRGALPDSGDEFERTILVAFFKAFLPGETWTLKASISEVLGRIHFSRRGSWNP